MGIERKRTTAQATAEGLRIFVAGVPWHVDEDLLRKDFEECGVIEDIFVLRDHEGNSKGRSFITYQEADAVQAALKFNNTKYGGRTIYVKLAEGKRGEDASQTKSHAPLTEKPEGSTSLCLKNIGDAQKKDITDFLKGCAVTAVRVVTDQKTGEARGVAFVDFNDTEDVDKAMKKNGKKIKELAVDMRFVEAKTAPSEKKNKAAHPEDKPPGCTSLCLKNIGEATEEDVWEHLDGCGVQSVRIVYDRVTGLSRSIAFVDFVDSEGVDKAVKCGESKLRGKQIEIRYEAPRDQPRPEGCLTVAVKKLPANTMEEDVRKLFKGLKSMHDLRIICDKMMACSGLAFAEFSEAADAEAAVQRTGMKVHGQTIFVCYETKQKKVREWQGGGSESTKKSEQKERRKPKSEQLKSEAMEDTPAKAKKRKQPDTGESSAKEAPANDLATLEAAVAGATSKKERRKAQYRLEEMQRQALLASKSSADAAQEACVEGGDEVAAEPKKKKKKLNKVV